MDDGFSSLFICGNNPDWELVKIVETMRQKQRGYKIMPVVPRKQRRGKRDGEPVVR